MAGRLLIVDDAMLMRMKIRQIAEDAGWDVAGEAGDGEQAVAMYADLAPDMVTMDMVMPRMGGLEALSAIRAADPAARVVMVSAVNQKERLRACIDAGALDFIVKPFDPARLTAFFAKYDGADHDGAGPDGPAA